MLGAKAVQREWDLDQEERWWTVVSSSLSVSSPARGPTRNSKAEQREDLENWGIHGARVGAYAPLVFEKVVGNVAEHEERVQRGQRDHEPVRSGRLKAAAEALLRRHLLLGLVLGCRGGQERCPF